MQILIDIYDCKSKILSNKKLIKKFLLFGVKKVNMTPIIKPKIIYYKAKDKIESGITGFIVLAESHISIHTYPYKRFVSLDIYSCKDFDSKELIKSVKKIFGTDKIKTKLIKRPLN